MTLQVVAAGDRNWDIPALGRLDELGPAAESIEWHSPYAASRALFERSRPGLKFVHSPPPDCGVPDKSLPFMGTPPAKPLGRFLVPDTDRVAEYRAALPGGPLAALVYGWPNRRRRIPLSELAPLASLGYTFICPQLGGTREELDELRSLGLSVVRPEDYDPADSLADEAALFELCDFAITAVCGEACIPAALGIPTYIISWAQAEKAGAARWFESVTVLQPPEPAAPPSEWTPLVTDLCSRLEGELGAP